MMEGQNCHNCRSWVEDIYWTHFQFHHFAQFLPTTYDQHLALPRTFSDNLKKKLPGNVGLKGPGGVVWNIGLTIRDDTVYFTKGWQQFVKDHSLKENDFLVFKFNGESTFDVLIFDGRSFCEKPAAYFVRDVGHEHTTELGGGCLTKRKDIDNSVEENNTNSNNAGVECASADKSAHVNSTRVPTAVPLETPRARKPLGTPSARKPLGTPSARKPLGTPRARTFNPAVESATPLQTFKAGVESASPLQVVDVDVDVDGDGDGDAEAEANANGNGNGVTVAGDAPSRTGKRIRKPIASFSPSQTNKRRGRSTTKVSNAQQEVVSPVSDPEPASAGKSGNYELYTSSRRPVTEDEINSAFQMAKAACTNDSLCVVMRPTHVYKRFFVSIPNKWILEHIPANTQDIIIRMVQNEWLAKYSYYNQRSNGGITGGWKHFALDNNLEENDVCVFKPGGKVNSTLILDVNIFRVVEEIKPLSRVKSPGKSGKKKSVRAIPM